jgi:citrate lyase subunit beta / citryl-CoA lyase
VALCETAAGVEAAGEIARHPSVDALMWGAEDLVASLSGRSSRHVDGRYRDVARYARSRVLIAAGAAGKAAWDAVHLDIGDLEGLRAEAEDAAASGFAATVCIHPSQAAVIRVAYAPTAVQVDEARALLRAADGEPGVFRFRGRMIDEPVLRQARRTLAHAQAEGGSA